MIYEINKTYRFEIEITKGQPHIIYTGEVVEKTETHLGIHTLRNENRSIRIEDIVQSIELKEGDY